MAVDSELALTATGGAEPLQALDHERVGAALDLLSGPLGADFAPAPRGLEDGVLELVELLAALAEETESEVPLTTPSEAASGDAVPDDGDEREEEATESPEDAAPPAAGPAGDGAPLGADAGGSAQAVAPFEEAGLGVPFGAAPRGGFEGGEGPGLAPPDADPNLVSLDDDGPLDLGALLDGLPPPPPVVEPEDEPPILLSSAPPGAPLPPEAPPDGPPAPPVIDEVPELQILA